MKQYNLSGKTILGISVPEGAKGDDGTFDGAEYFDFEYLDLPEGEWQIMFRAKDCTEEQAASIVERHRDQWGFGMYKNYADEFSPLDESLDTALESFRSWLKSNNIPDETVLLIKK